MKTQTNDEKVTACPVSRWATLKATLNNLMFEEFVERSRKDPDAQVLDVRTREEYMAGSMEGAINIDYLSPELADELESLPRDKTYYVFCRTSRRSTRICVILQNAGFDRVYNLDNGLRSNQF